MPWIKVDGKRRYVTPPPIGQTVTQGFKGAKRPVRVYGFVPANPVVSRQQRRLFLRQMMAGLHVG